MSYYVDSSADDFQGTSFRQFNRTNASPGVCVDSAIFLCIYNISSIANELQNLQPKNAV